MTAPAAAPAAAASTSPAVARSASPAESASPSPALLARLYREMLRLRTLDERMMTLQRQGRVGFYGACSGQEAATLASASAAHAQFKRAGTLIFGISADSLASHEKFKQKMGFPFELLSDPDQKVCKLYDVIQEKSMYGKKFLGIERSTFVIDGKGVLRHAWRKVKVKGHAAAVLAAVKAL